jgi:DNA (cytosine-5)-methyltransferase 1
MNPIDAHTILDLFCGAGGLSLGFRRAGFQVIQAVDNNRAALQTYKANLGGHVVDYDLTQALVLPDTTVIVGGPPCQGFSSAGLRRYDDRRNSLVGQFARIIAEKLPSCFVFENVEGFLTAEQGDRVIELLDPVIEAGYVVQLRKLNAANFGVPQHRKRVIAIGGRGWKPSFPLPTHSAYGAPGASRAAQNLTLTPTIMEALANLPDPGHEPPGSPEGHYTRLLTGVDLERAVALQPGQTMKDLPEALQHESFQRRAFRRVMDGTASERRGGAPAGIKRLRPNEPSKAITGGAMAEFLHPLENRSLTLRECARLQTFPDTYTFFGTVATQMQLIGNAVPPLLAEHIARSVMIDISQGGKPTTSGALLSFVPTLSDGASPILRQVIERVCQRYFGKPSVQRHTLWD